MFTDYGEMLRHADIDAVAILTPHTGHAEQCLAALEYGKHVMIEKPLANTLADALKIRQLAESNGLIVSSAPPNMLHPGQRRLMQLLSMDVIGKVCLVRNTMSSMGPGSRPGAPTDFSGFIRKAPVVCPAWAATGLSR